MDHPVKSHDPEIIPPGDPEAIEIGKLYHLARTSLVGSIRYCIECGHKLIAKKETLNYGEWLPWLRDNEEALGFKRRAAQLLMKTASNAQLTAYLDEATAAAISRKLWGNEDSQLVQQSLNNEHYTPSQYLEAAWTVLGTIDLDPASCAEANRIVRAKNFYTADDNGLVREWSGNVWLNPPYGRHVGDFVDKFVGEYSARRITAGIVLINAHCTDTEWFQSLWDGVLCFTNHRINFYGDDERSGSTHGSVFIYFGQKKGLFAETFKQFGAVVARFAR